MKAIIYAPILALVIIGTANAGVLPTAGSNSAKSDATAAAPAQKPTRTSAPTDFYIAAKGGFNSLSGSFSFDSNDPGVGFNGGGSALFGGAVGIDLNSPKVKIEFEVLNVSAKDVKFKDGFGDLMHASVGYTSFMVNAIPYFKINDTLNFNIILGLGGASVNLTDTDEFDLFAIEASGGFAVNLGAGLDIRITDNFSIVPEARFNGIIGSAKIYNAFVHTSPNLFISNVQALIGLKITF